MDIINRHSKTFIVHFALTELSYITALETMINRYKKPLTAIVKMSLVPDSDTPQPIQYLTVKEIEIVFSNIELLLGLNKVWNTIFCLNFPQDLVCPFVAQM